MFIDASSCKTFSKQCDKKKGDSTKTKTLESYVLQKEVSSSTSLRFLLKQQHFKEKINICFSTSLYWTTDHASKTAVNTLYRQASFRFLIGKQTTAVLQISSFYTCKQLTAMHKADRYDNQTVIIMASKLIWKKFNGLPKFSILCISDHIERCSKDRALERVYICCFGERYMQL